MTTPIVQCHGCKHYQSYDTCRAFKDGIPREILEGKFMHVKPRPEQIDKKILFEAVRK